MIITMMISAIETHYAGCRFRSRLEARWAVFFDHLGIRWEYEPKGFMTDAGPYLPDFRLPDYRLFVEVKGTEPTERDFDRCQEIAMACRKHGGNLIIVQGDIPNPDDCPWSKDSAWYFNTNDAGWAIMPLHEAWGMATGDWYWGCSKGLNDFTDALRAARSARFEHGESGAVRRCQQDRYATEQAAYFADDFHPFATKVVRCRGCGAWHIVPDD